MTDTKIELQIDECLKRLNNKVLELKSLMFEKKLKTKRCMFTKCEDGEIRFLLKTKGLEICKDYKKEIIEGEWGYIINEN